MFKKQRYIVCIWILNIMLGIVFIFFFTILFFKKKDIEHCKLIIGNLVVVFFIHNNSKPSFLITIFVQWVWERVCFLLMYDCVCSRIFFFWFFFLCNSCCMYIYVNIDCIFHNLKIYVNSRLYQLLGFLHAITVSTL